MKKFLVFFLAFFVFWSNGYGELNIKGPTVTATTESVDGYDAYITEIYSWNPTSESYVLEDSYNAHIKLKVPVAVFAEGKGNFSVWSEGDLHKYSSPYHPVDESPVHVSALTGDSLTGVKVGSGWPWIIFSGMEARKVIAEGTLVTDTPDKYEVKGRGKVFTSSGGGSGSAGGVGVGTSPVSASGSWIYDKTSFRISVLDIRPPQPSTSK